MKQHNSLFFFLPLIIFSVLFLRLFDLQIVHGREMREISEQNRFFQKPILASRGVFFDRLGKQLVFNKPFYVQLEQPTQIYSTTRQLSVDEALQQLAQHPETIFSRPYREYVSPHALGQVLGYVGKVTKEDLDRDHTIKREQMVGKSGLEKTFDRELRGTNGVETFELNAKGEIQRSVAIEPATAGENITLSIDQELNQESQRLLGDRRGTVIIGDPLNGEILSLVSSPNFDTNLFTLPTYSEDEERARNASISAAFQDSRQLFFNRAISGTYPPGSVFKMITAMAGLEKGVLKTDTIVVDEGILKVDEYQYGNWYFRQYGRVEGALDVTRALARSNDIFFYKAAEWIQPEELAESSRLFGLGAKTHIELPAESTGLVPDPQWKLQTFGERWYLGNTYHFGIGQGDLTVTPIQVFQYTTAFANHGKMCAPTLVKGKQGQCKELGYHDEYIQTVYKGMEQACSRGGTGFPFFEWNETHENKVACKTGTAEFGAADAQGHRRTHGWFTAFTELPSSEFRKQHSDYPQKIVVTVLVESDEEHPYREGSGDAGPIAFELVKWLTEHR